MDTWTPITLQELSNEISSSELRMEAPQLRFWNAIRIGFVKWQLSPWGDLGKGFWVVGQMGDQVLWYNDIEDGFNWSRYSEPGVIAEYYCNQDELRWAIGSMYYSIMDNKEYWRLGPPRPLSDDEEET